MTLKGLLAKWDARIDLLNRKAKAKRDDFNTNVSDRCAERAEELSVARSELLDIIGG